MFKTKFQNVAPKFDSKKHTFVSFDAKSLFTSVNVKRTVDAIISKIYNNPDAFFDERVPSEDDPDEFVKLPIIPKKVLKNIMLECLTKFSSFSCKDTFFRQKDGLSMGSKLSPALANIFCNLMEQECIKPLIGNKLIFYCRYVDDCFCICLKNTEGEIMTKMNNFDHNLIFTIERPIDQHLNFLDTTIFEENGRLKYKFYKKPSSSDVTQNYNLAITPKKYLNSTLTGEIFRHSYCNTAEKDLENSLHNLKKHFVSNNYPPKLIDQKISEIKNRNFTSLRNKSEEENEFRENRHKIFSLSLSFTSKRCETISRKIIKCFKSITPEYRINLCWKNITLRQLICPRLKANEPIQNKIGVCYKFTCPCGQEYIGETIRRLSTRIKEHQRPQGTTAICHHIRECDEYKLIRLEKCGPNPKAPERIRHHSSFFTILGSGLQSYIDRKSHEALQIFLADPKPKLNDQIKHRGLVII